MPPNALERKALRNLDNVGVPKSDMLCGAKTFKSIMEKSWAKCVYKAPPGQDKYAITELGEAALREATPKTLRTGPKLSQLPRPIGLLPPQIPSEASTIKKRSRS